MFCTLCRAQWRVFLERVEERICSTRSTSRAVPNVRRDEMESAMCIEFPDPAAVFGDKTAQENDPVTA